MKLSEIIVESQNLEEGPLANKVGNVVGNAAGTVAKGIGAVAGGVAGTWDAMKKGFKAGKTKVAQGGDEPADTTAPAAGAGTTPPAATDTAAPAAGVATGQPTGTPKQSRPPKSDTPFGRLSQAAAGSEEPEAGTAAPAATPAATPAAAPASTAAPAATGTDMPTKPFQVPGAGTNPNPTATGKPTAPEAPAAGSETPQAAPAANDSAYAKAQKAISGLQPEQQKELMSVLMSDPKVKAALTAKPAAQAAAPEAPTSEPTAPATAAPAAPEAPTATPAPTGEPVPKKKGRKPKPVAPSQAELDADRERIMGMTSDSVIRKGKLVAEDAAVIKDLETFKRGFERGAADPFGMSKDSPAAAAPTLNDPTNLVPQDIMAKVVSLDSAQRTQLYTLLRGKRI